MLYSLQTLRVHSLFKALVITAGLAGLSSLPRHFTLTICWTHVLDMPCTLYNIGTVCYTHLSAQSTAILLKLHADAMCWRYYSCSNGKLHFVKVGSKSGPKIVANTQIGRLFTTEHSTSPFTDAIDHKNCKFFKLLLHMTPIKSDSVEILSRCLVSTIFAKK